jgi:hypothetical protein
LLERVVLGTLLLSSLTQAIQLAQLLAEARTLLRWGRAEARRVGSAGIAGLLAAWDTLAATREGLPLAHGSEGGAAPLELLTAHSAKALEWEQVWLLDEYLHARKRPQAPGVGTGVAARLPAKRLAAESARPGLPPAARPGRRAR